MVRAPFSCAKKALDNSIDRFRSIWHPAPHTREAGKRSGLLPVPLGLFAFVPCCPSRKKQALFPSAELDGPGQRLFSCVVGWPAPDDGRGECQEEAPAIRRRQKISRRQCQVLSWNQNYSLFLTRNCFAVSGKPACAQRSIISCFCCMEMF